MYSKLKKLEISNFRGIEELAIEFVDPREQPTRIGVLAGPNGCGKTSILEAILVVTGHAELARGKTNAGAIRSGSDDFSIRAEFIHMSTPQETTSVEVSSRSRKPVSPVVVVYFSSWREPKLPGSLGITAGKRGRRPNQNEENRLWLLKQYLINAQANALFTSRSGQRQLSIAVSESAFDSALQRLHQVWGRFYSDQKFTVEPVDQTPDSGFDLFLHTNDGSRVSVDDLSSGQLEVLQFCADFMISESPVDILLIDEPELHLDPSWHRQILLAIHDLSPETQIIVGTHSPEIYDAAMSYERHFLVPEDDPRAQNWDTGVAAS